MYQVYFDSGTTNSRIYLIRDGRIVDRMKRQVGAKNSALEHDNTTLLRGLYELFTELLAGAGVTEAEVEHVYLSGMISSPSGIVEIEHLPTPVDAAELRDAIVPYEEKRFFHRTLEIIPGLKTLERQTFVKAADAAAVNIMRGEEIEIFGVLRENPSLKQGRAVLILPGSHTHAALLEDGRITGISSNITGELFQAIVSQTILGASIEGDEPWKIEEEYVRLGAHNVHAYGFNRALYIVRILDLFSECSDNERRSYLEGVLNVGVLDAVSAVLDSDEPVRLAVVDEGIQRDIFEALCKGEEQRFELTSLAKNGDMPYSVSGLLELLG